MLFLSSSRVKLQKNILKLVNVDSWHEAVFQCVAENNQGMSVTSTRVHVEGGCVKKKKKKMKPPKFRSAIISYFCLLIVQISDPKTKIRRCLISFAPREQKCLTGKVTQSSELFDPAYAAVLVL